MTKNEATFDEFKKIDIRVGKVTRAELIDGAKFSTHKLEIDFGHEIGVKKSCARIVNYKPEDLVDKQVLAVVNFPPRQIGQNMSEVLTLGVPDGNDEVTLIVPDSNVPTGGQLF